MSNNNTDSCTIVHVPKRTTRNRQNCARNAKRYYSQKRNDYLNELIDDCYQEREWNLVAVVNMVAILYYYVILLLIGERKDKSRVLVV